MDDRARSEPIRLQLIWDWQGLGAVAWPWPRPVLSVLTQINDDVLPDVQRHWHVDRLLFCFAWRIASVELALGSLRAAPGQNSNVFMWNSGGKKAPRNRSAEED